jgi:hypothetical protein
MSKNEKIISICNNMDKSHKHMLNKKEKQLEHICTISSDILEQEK